MNTKLFGQFLLEKGCVSREQLLLALESQREAARTLGDLAVATGMLDLKEVDAIHLLQHVENKPFSQAAVDLGLLTERQIADLLHPNSAERMLLGQILLAFGYIDQDTLDAALELHAGERMEDESDLMSHFRGSDLLEVGPTCISIMRRVFKQTMRAPVSIHGIPPSKAISASQAVWSQAVSRGNDRFLLALQVGEGDGCAMAQGVLGMPVPAFGDLARDAVSEFLNVVTGHVCANLDGSVANVSAAPPAVQYPMDFLEKARPGISVLCISDHMEFSYVIARPVAWTATQGRAVGRDPAHTSGSPARRVVGGR